MKRATIVLFLLSIITNTFAQGNLQKKYVSIQGIGHIQTGAYPGGFYNGENYESEKPFGAEFGVGYQVQLGTTPLYLETGAFVGLITARASAKSERWESKLFRLKVPFCLNYMLNVSNGLIIYPSLGIAAGFAPEKYVDEYYYYAEGSDYGSRFSIGGVAPTVGVNAIISDKILVGIGYELYWSTATMGSISSIAIKAGYVF